MNKTKFKNRVGITLILSHFIIIIWIIVCKFLGGFEFEELTTSISLLTPLFAAYSSLIIKDFIANMEQKEPSKTIISKPFSFITFFVIYVFSFYLLAIITIKAFNLGFNQFEEFKSLLAISETLFGVYVGQITYSLFSQEKEKEVVNA